MQQDKTREVVTEDRVDRDRTCEKENLKRNGSVRKSKKSGTSDGDEVKKTRKF